MKDIEYPFVSLSKPFIDQRGVIQPLVDIPLGSALRITSKKGSIRANHVHGEDWHYCYLDTGLMWYYFRRFGSGGETERVIVEPGQMVFTPPGVAHAMQFLEDSTFYVYARLQRSQEQYETDTIRVKLI